MRSGIAVVAVLALVLAVTPALAEMTVLWDRYDRTIDVGVCLALDSNGNYWIVRYRDGRPPKPGVFSGTPGQFDPGFDHVYGRYLVRQTR